MRGGWGGRGAEEFLTLLIIILGQFSLSVAVCLRHQFVVYLSGGGGGLEEFLTLLIIILGQFSLSVSVSVCCLFLCLCVLCVFETSICCVFEWGGRRGGGGC